MGHGQQYIVYLKKKWSPMFKTFGKKIKLCGFVNEGFCIAFNMPV